ncbi:hypothetical protein NDI85_19135 [Halomicroarcula sp. S1AR25-4]|uniref:hypothetical protein n=1 Tax=Haloarcula sp. S1AR25-4 TaxID=2950538 RepID=UPI002876F254|nr:hypothetical protein [Halomicroarcula sp. S1AR25-4]MDS0279902.1 hypothetical protein [Halomicroarcula sp. S1AR25-4]
MEWRCEWCGKPHEENDPPCDNCGHGTYERAVQPVGPTRSADGEVHGGSVWVCQDCGRQHQRNSPPCRRCGSANFERERVADTDPMADIGTSWRDVLEPKYVAGYAAVAVLLGVVLLSVFGVVTLPGFGSEAAAGPPEIPSAPGSADTADGLSLAATEDAYLDALNERRTSEGAGALTRNATADDAAAYYNKAIVAARAGDGSGPEQNAFERFGLACERPNIVAYQVAYDRTGRSVSDFDSEAALAASLVDSYVERGNRFRAAEAGTVGVDIHVAPDGSVFVTYVVC